VIEDAQNHKTEKLLSVYNITQCAELEDQNVYVPRLENLS